MGTGIMLGPGGAQSFVPSNPSGVSFSAIVWGQFPHTMCLSVLQWKLEGSLCRSLGFSLGSSLLSSTLPENYSCWNTRDSQLHLFNSGSHWAVPGFSSSCAGAWKLSPGPEGGAIVGLALFVSHFSWITVLCCLMSIQHCYFTCYVPFIIEAGE